MAHLCTQLTPLGSRSTIGELDQVEGIVDIRLQVVDSHVRVLVIVLVLELAGKAAAQHRQRLCSNLLRQQEELIEAETIGLIIVGIETMRESIVPAILVERAVLSRSHTVLPLIASCQISAFYDTSTGETEDAWVKIFQVFHQVGTQSMPVILREEADMIEVYAVGTLQEDAHQTLLDSLVGGERHRFLRPLVVGDSDLLLVDRVILVVDKLYTNLSFLALQVVETGKDREIIVHTLLQSHAEEAAVLQSCELLVVTGALQYHVVGIAVKGRFHVADADIAEGVPAHQPLRKFKTAVFDHLGIESAVGAEVDIFEEDTVHRRLDGRTRLGVDGQLSLSRSPREGEQAKGQRDKHFSSMVHK